MTPALAAAYVAIAAVLTCCRVAAVRLRRAREAIETAYACLLVDDDTEAYAVLEAAIRVSRYEDRPTLNPTLSRIGGQL